MIMPAFGVQLETHYMRYFFFLIGVLVNNQHYIKIHGKLSVGLCNMFCKGLCTW